MTKAEIQLLRSLDDKRARTEAGLFIAEGEKLVRELLASHFEVAKIFFTDRSDLGAGLAKEMAKGATERISDAEERARRLREAGAKGATERISDTEGMEAERIPNGVSERVSVKDMERVSRLKTPSDCLALVRIPPSEFDPAALKGTLALALDDVQNPGNVGTIIRLADWFGISDILCSEGTADCFNPKVVQATMGAITRVRVHYGDLAGMLAAVPTPVFGTFLEGDNIYTASLPVEGVIVLGNEGQGIGERVRRVIGQKGQKLFVPPYPADNTCPESLNVAVAAAIAVAEFRRRTSKPII